MRVGDGELKIERDVLDAVQRITERTTYSGDWMEVAFEVRSTSRSVGGVELEINSTRSVIVLKRTRSYTPDQGSYCCERGRGFDVVDGGGW